MKRFFDTELFKKPWFMSLKTSEKMAWFYLIAHCDNVGVWTPNTLLADFMIGEPVDWDGLRDKANGNIFLMDNGKWWLVDFCRFQHPDLNESSGAKPVQSYIKLLKSHGLWLQYTKAMDTVPIAHAIGYKVKVKEREQVREREKEEAQEIAPGVFLTDSELSKLSDKYGKRNVEIKAAALSSYIVEEGREYKSHYLTLNKWLTKDGAKPEPEERITEIPDFMKEVVGLK